MFLVCIQIRGSQLQIYGKAPHPVRSRTTDGFRRGRADGGLMQGTSQGRTGSSTQLPGDTGIIMQNRPEGIRKDAYKRRMDAEIPKELSVRRLRREAMADMSWQPVDTGFTTVSPDGGRKEERWNIRKCMPLILTAR